MGKVQKIDEQPSVNVQVHYIVTLRNGDVKVCKDKETIGKLEYRNIGNVKQCVITGILGEADIKKLHTDGLKLYNMSESIKQVDMLTRELEYAKTQLNKYGEEELEELRHDEIKVLM